MVVRLVTRRNKYLYFLHSDLSSVTLVSSRKASSGLCLPTWPVYFAHWSDASTRRRFCGRTPFFCTRAFNHVVSMITGWLAWEESMVYVLISKIDLTRNQMLSNHHQKEPGSGETTEQRTGEAHAQKPRTSLSMLLYKYAHAFLSSLQPSQRRRRKSNSLSLSHTHIARKKQRDMANLFLKQAKQYAATRPAYPPELFKYIASKTARHDLVWDVGTGSGQAAASVS